MRPLLIVLSLITFSSSDSIAQSGNNKPPVADTARNTQVVEASCGQCQFKMEGKGCDLAVRIKGKSYFVDGTSIDQHGDAHAADGFCEAIRKAEVKGEIVNGRFKATWFKLLPEEKKPAPASPKKDN